MMNTGYGGAVGRVLAVADDDLDRAVLEQLAAGLAQLI